MRGSPMRRRLFLEGLESRRLLTAASASAELDGGVLSIAATGKNDRIQVALADTLLKVKVNKQCFEFTAVDVTAIHIDGGKGNDWICVDQSVLTSATINGGVGNDHVGGGGGDDTIVGDQGNDKLFGGGGHDVISGGAGNDCLDGGDGDDFIHGDDGNDRVFGGAGLDELLGDSGHDKLDGGDGEDLLEGGRGKDHLHGGAANDQLFGNDDKDHLWGGDGDDQLFGGASDDHLFGDLGNDTLKGEAGNDKLDGGAGTNLLDGDEGRNKYKNGEVVDLDAVTPGLVAQLNDFSGQGMVGVARYDTVVESGRSIGRLTVTVENVAPPQSGGQVQMRVVVEELWLGDLTVDSATGRGTFSFTGVEILDGYFISIGTSLTGAFAAA
jgi:Ca2+-binding RTX toxin-like protein